MYQPRILAALAAVLLSSSAHAATKSYQVTGTVDEVTDQKIVVTKGKEKFEIARESTTKTSGDVKAGEKVTVYYRMSADEIEAKPAKPDAKKKK